jgi:hypothetical protein
MYFTGPAYRNGIAPGNGDENAAGRPVRGVWMQVFLVPGMDGVLLGRWRLPLWACTTEMVLFLVDEGSEITASDNCGHALQEWCYFW